MVANPDWKYANFAESTLQAALTLTGTEVLVAPSDAADWPILVSPQKFAISIWDGENDPEICHVSENPGNGTLTVTRGEEGSNQQVWAAGSRVRVEMTAEMWQDMMDRLAALE